MADWLKILKEQAETGEEMQREVPKMLADPEISADQVKKLFAALEKQAQFAEQLKQALEALGHDFAVVDQAGALEESYSELAATAAEKLKGMRG